MTNGTSDKRPAEWPVLVYMPVLYRYYIKGVTIGQYWPRRSSVVACWASDHWVASSNPLRGKFRHSFRLIIPGVCLAQFSLNNVHKRGLKHHHFIISLASIDLYACSISILYKMSYHCSVLVYMPVLCQSYQKGVTIGQYWSMHNINFMYCYVYISIATKSHDCAEVYQVGTP